MAKRTPLSDQLWQEGRDRAEDARYAATFRSIVEIYYVVTPILLALILWRVW